MQAWAAPGVSSARAPWSLPRVRGGSQRPERSPSPQCLLRGQAALLTLPCPPLPPLGFTDREAVQDLENSLKEIRKTAGGTALYYAGLFLWLVGHRDKAKEYIDRTLKVSSSPREVPASGIMRAAAAESSIQTHQPGVTVTPPGAPRGPGEGRTWARTRPWVSQGPLPTLSQGSAEYTLARVRSLICRQVFRSRCRMFLKSRMSC